MNENIEYRNSSDWKAAADGEKIDGYAAVVEVPTVLYRDPDTGIEYKEMIARDAFAGADLSDITFLVQHQSTPVYARTRGGSLVVNVDSHGLHFTADLSRTEKSKDLYRDIRAGMYDQCSFAFTIAAEHYEAETRTRVIDQIDKVFDCCVCDRGAYPTTEVHARAFSSVAEADRQAYLSAEVEQIRSAANAIDGIEGRTAEDFTAPDRFFGKVAEDDVIRGAVCELRDASYTTIADAMAAKEKLQDLRDKLLECIEKRAQFRAAVAAGTVPTKVIESESDYVMRKENNMENNFYNTLVEKRAAGNVSGMGNIIPQEIVRGQLREGVNGLYDDISFSHISNGGSVKIPYIADSAIAVNEHAENAAITPASNVPAVVTITHGELEATLGYSYLGVQVAAEEFKDIISGVLMSAMRKKLDAKAVDAINGMTWVKDSGATQNAVQWAAAGAPKLSEILALMKLLPAQYADAAKLYMSRATALSIVEGSTGVIDASNHTNGMYNIDPVSALDKMFGVPIVIDSNIAAGDILYGNPAAVHMNFAGEVMFNDWMDHDSLTEKLQIACVVGADAEIGSFVKGSNAIDVA